MKPVKKRAYFILKFLLLLLICSIIIWYLSMVVYFVFQWNLFFSPHQTILVEITESDGPHYFGDKAACYVLRARKNTWLELDWKNVDCDVIEEIDKYIRVYGMTIYDTIEEEKVFYSMEYMFYEKNDNKLWLLFDRDGRTIYAYEYIG